MSKMMSAAVIAVMAFGGSAMAKPGSTTVAAGDLKWADVPGFTGVHLAPAEGDPNKGAAHFFMKFDKGFTAPDHHHTADHYVTVISGTMIMTIDGKEQKFGPGSYFSFTGKKVHATKCDAASDCVIEIDARGKWDVVPEKAAAKPADAKPAAGDKKPADAKPAAGDKKPADAKPATK